MDHAVEPAVNALAGHFECRITPDEHNPTRSDQPFSDSPR
jgi:hypothetical protein